MIVQCDQCNSKFRLDDSKVKEGGVKVRCSKCKNIFVVRAEVPAEEADFDSFLSGLTPPPPEAPHGPEPTAPTAEPSVGQIPDVKSSAGPAAAPVAHDKPAGQDIDLSEFAFNEQAFSPASLPANGAEPGTAHREGFDAREFSFNSESLAPGAPSALSPEGEVPRAQDSVFGELDLDMGESRGTLPKSGAEVSSPEEFAFGEESSNVPEFELNIDGLDTFDQVERRETADAAAAGAPEKSPAAVAPEEFSFDAELEPSKGAVAGEDFFAETAPEFSFEPEASEVQAAHLGTEKGISEPPAPFDFGDFDFGRAAGTEAGGTSEAMSSAVQEPHAPSDIRFSAPPLPETISFEEEPPPLSISSRRKGGSPLPIAMIAISVILLLVLAGGGFYVFTEGPTALNKIGLGFMAGWFGAGSHEDGGISARNTTGVFLNNKEMGEIFVVNGEAVNNFTKPRAAIQVKVTLFGQKGAALVQKTAYCGNVLSRDQLTTLPAAKLEAAMNNQFGDSLSNLSVQPGKGIPFVVVFSGVPKEVVEFGVEVVGSTVSSQ